MTVVEYRGRPDPKPPNRLAAVAGSASVTFGLASIFTSCVWWLAIPSAAVAVPLGLYSRRRARRFGATGDRHARGGVLAGVLGLVLALGSLWSAADQRRRQADLAAALRSEGVPRSSLHVVAGPTPPGPSASPPAGSNLAPQGFQSQTFYTLPDVDPEITGSVHLVGVYAGGRLQGFRVATIRPGSLLEKNYGVRAGDEIVPSTPGHPFEDTDPLEVATAWFLNAASSGFTVRVVRDGQTLDLTSNGSYTYGAENHPERRDGPSKP